MMDAINPKINFGNLFSMIDVVSTWVGFWELTKKNSISRLEGDSKGKEWICILKNVE